MFGYGLLFPCPLGQHLTASNIPMMIPPTAEKHAIRTTSPVPSPLAGINQVTLQTLPGSDHLILDPYHMYIDRSILNNKIEIE